MPSPPVVISIKTGALHWGVLSFQPRLRRRKPRDLVTETSAPYLFCSKNAKPCLFVFMFSILLFGVLLLLLLRRVLWVWSSFEERQ